MAAEVTVNDLQEICNDIESLILPSFGPNGLKSMLCTDTGKLVITSDGISVLNSLHSTHPVGKLVTEAISSFHKQNGDMSKSFIILLKNIIGELQDQCGVNKSSMLAAVRHSVGIIQESTVKCLKYCDVICILKTRINAVKHAISIIVTSSLKGKLDLKTVKRVSEIVVQWFCEEDGVEQMETKVCHHISNYTVLTTECPGYPAWSSQLVGGILIDGHCLVFHKDILKQSVKFALLSYDPTKRVTSEENYTVQVQGEKQSIQCLKWEEKIVSSVIDRLKAVGVNLLLYSETASTAMVQICNTHDVTLVHCVSLEYLQYISDECGSDILYNMQDITWDKRAIVGSAGSCVEVAVNKNRYLVLQNLHCGDKCETDLGETCHLLVCAPTAGMCRQLSLCILNTLKLLRAWLNHGDYKVQTTCPDQQSAGWNSGGTDLSGLEYRMKKVGKTSHAHGVAFLGGGAFEVTLHKELSCFLDTHQELTDSTKVALKAVSKALLSIPLALLSNSYSQNIKHNGSLQLERLVLSSPHLCGVNGISGASIVTNRDVLEAVSVKCSLLFAVLELLQQLLKVDYMCSVVKLTQQQDSDSEEESV